MASYNPLDLDTIVEDKKQPIIQNGLKNEMERDIIKVEIKTEHYSDDDTEFIDNLKSDIAGCYVAKIEENDVAEYYIAKIEENELNIKQEDEEIIPDEVKKNHRHHKYLKKQCSCCETVSGKARVKGCSICGKKFKTDAGLKIHLSVHTRENNKFKCSVCDKEFTQKSSLKRHMVIHDTSIYNKEKCDLCNVYVVNLIRHQLIHTGQKDYTCQYCDKTFSLYHNLKAHLFRHGDQLFTCFECNQQFDDKIKLKRHIIRHGDNKRFKCDVCEKSFFFNKNLTQHLLTHTGEKKFKCNICEKSFLQHGHLKTHLITHTDERKFKCDLCNVSFRFNTNLTRHIKRHGTSKKKKRRAGKSSKEIEIVKQT